MNILKHCLTCAITVALLVQLSPPASADIIVVEGRLTDDDGTPAKASNETDDTKPAVGLTLPAVVFTPLVPPAHNNDDVDKKADHPYPPTTPSDCDDELNEDLCEMDEEPEGYTCEDIGHGMELCEKTEDDAGAEEDVDENTETGCSAAGGDLNPSSGLLVLCLFAFWALRRNQLVNSRS